MIYAVSLYFPSGKFIHFKYEAYCLVLSFICNARVQGNDYSRGKGWPFPAVVGLLLALGLSACGTIYKTPTIRDDSSAQIPFDVIELTPAAIQAANGVSYSPRPLPAAFRGPLRGVAGTGGLPPEPGVTEYRIGPGDVISIVPTRLATGEPGADQGASGEFRVRDDGTIDLSRLGALSIGGLSIAEADTALKKLLRNRQTDPSYRIEIVEFNARTVPVDGAVAAPGLVPLTQVPMTLDKALAARGGLRAEVRSSATVTLHRVGRSHAYRGDDLAMLSRVVLRDGDSVVVDPGESSEELRARFSQLDALDAVARDTVYLVGEARSPRSIQMPFDRQLFLSDVALDKGGVPLETGNMAAIYVLRSYGRNGGVAIYHLDAGNIVNLVLATRMELRPGDLIFVSEQPVTRWSRVLKQLSPATITSVAANVRD
ncbi:polysaccharide biosynthesis/export family protein [Rhodovulum steppense]|uniref:polysaccharide biosynthesis/export family protein n=1 Tax=Rhodovulum steppense TaxID=540251 RepID=UPI001404580C|nr:polysaccharide biosynthesis/export family protein [Rhodovulum steppense]